MNILFVEPASPASQRHCVRALSLVGATVDALVATAERHRLTAATVREAHGRPGTSVHDASRP